MNLAPVARQWLVSGLLAPFLFITAHGREINGNGVVTSCPSCVSRSLPSDLPARQDLAQFSGGSSNSAAMGGWHLVRTPGPEKGVDVVSVMRTGDLSQSDPEFAGLAIRCRAKAGLQVAFVVIAPFRPRSHPMVAVSANGATLTFKSDVIPPGSMIALPDEAEVLAKGAWQSANLLSVEIDSEGDGGKIHGAVSLENLAGAIAQLQASCP